ncbi:MAG: DUF3810 domain-containing protein [Bacteroidota bacterium]
MHNRYKKIIAFSLIAQIALVKWLGLHPEWIERYYSEGVYPYLSRFMRWHFGWIPFSMGDIFYTLLALAAIRFLYLHGRRIWKRPSGVILDLGVVAAIAYFLFHVLWGMNYYRLPLSEKWGMKEDYSVTELADFTTYLITKTNQSQIALTRDSVLAVKVPLERDAIFKGAIASYQNVAEVYPHLTYPQTSLKRSLYSLPLTYMGFGGYLNPFTGEAQVNSKIPKLRYPTVSCHEMGHQIGYASESETNFIGFLVTSHSKDPYFQYAVNTHALAYCLSDLKLRDETLFDQLWATLNEGVKTNYRQHRKFWKAYENVTEPFFEALLNVFLKANDQKDGIQSYNKVVGLLVNYHSKYGF